MSLKYHKAMGTLASSEESRGVSDNRRVALAVADELVNLTATLSELAYDLGSDAETLRKHIRSIQSIDLVTQIQISLSEFLRSEEELETRISVINVEDLSERLKINICSVQ